MAHLLLVDDSEVMRELLRDALEDHHTVVGEAGDGADAIEIVSDQSDSIDVVMMDIVMPEVDGIEATRQIKEIDPTIKIVFCTSVTQQDRMKKAIEAGADGYIAKPFEGETVNVAIEDVHS
ncbi:response regulator [Natronolimnohabitans innermongolicus]|uniref:Response regulator receiver protein n=1 Tax=Natronolimnohabitans innermongolicus JCM 12255 TaxID=1227499 RepID=L9WI61_9EURY|nr:response regulator [Natronolimnohabitans innermongolicus]ELY49200.1 response regulator receiver protein [Natronolimnohabitans innermongolicus JCM 12255]